MIKSADEFKMLRESENQQEYSRAATDEASLEVWLEVLSKYPDLAFWVAQNKSVPVEILEKLATNEDDNVRAMVESKRKLPEKIMLLLAEDSSESVRLALANNAKVTKNVLKKLVDDSWQEVSKKQGNRKTCALTSALCSLACARSDRRCCAAPAAHAW